MKKRWELNGLIMRRKTETVKPLNPKLYIEQALSTY